MSKSGFIFSLCSGQITDDKVAEGLGGNLL